MRTAFYTLGCKLNQLETEALASAFRSRGFFIAPWEDQADLYIINTCTVTSKSEQKARRIIRKIGREHPSAIVVVTGCYVELEEESLRREFNNVILVPQHKKGNLLSAAAEIGDFPKAERLKELVDKEDAEPRIFDYTPESFQFHSRAYLKIQDGCDNRCAYCRVPLARGKSLSIDPDEAAAKVKSLEERNFAEVILTGVNISSYRYNDFRLSDLLSKLLSESSSLRFRISSLEPDMTGESLISLFAHPRIRPHFHLPLQSGSDRILRLMKRKYLSDTSRRVIRDLREAKGDPFIAADIIVGFPGETEEDFELTRSLLGETEPARLHVFQFSPRPGTAAFEMGPKIPERVMKERSKILRDLSDSLYRKYVRRWKGREVEGVVIQREGESITVLTENYLQMRVKQGSGGEFKSGKICRVTIHGL